MGERFTPTAIKKLLAEKFAAVGFTPTWNGRRRIVRPVNPETEAFIYLDVRRRSRRIVIDAMVGIDSVPLRTVLARTGGDVGRSRVCFVLVGFKAGWGELVIRDDASREELEPWFDRIVDDALNIALPLVLRYDSLEKACQLFRVASDPRVIKSVAVVSEHMKLPLAEGILAYGVEGMIAKLKAEQAAG